MKITYIVVKNLPFGGGIEKYTEEIGSRLAGRGHQVTVYTIKRYGKSPRIYKGMHIKPVAALKIRTLEKMSAAFIAAVRQCIDKDVDIVHFHAFGPAMFSLIPRLQGKNVIVQGHGLEWKRSRWSRSIRFFLWITEFFSVKFANKITVVSRVQQKYLRQKYGVESVYIPTGINPPVIRSPELIKRLDLIGNDYIFFAGRLVKEKGVHYLIEAYNKINTNLKLVIAGDASYEPKYKELLYKMSAGNNKIIFTGYISGKMLEELLSNSYLFVLPSEVEGLPTALLEAMSYGNCCLVSNIPENLEALNGLGYSFRNRDIGDLADNMQRLINNQNAIEIVKSKARNYALEHYSWDKIAIQFENFYRGIDEPGFVTVGQ